MSSCLRKNTHLAQSADLLCLGLCMSDTGQTQGPGLAHRPMAQEPENRMCLCSCPTWIARGLGVGVSLAVFGNARMFEIALGIAPIARALKHGRLPWSGLAMHHH